MYEGLFCISSWPAFPFCLQNNDMIVSNNRRASREAQRFYKFVLIFAVAASKLVRSDCPSCLEVTSMCDHSINYWIFQQLSPVTKKNLIRSFGSFWQQNSQ